MYITFKGKLMILSGLDELILIKYVTYVLRKNVEIKIENNNIMYRNGTFKWSIFSASPAVTLKAAYTWNAKQKKRGKFDV